MADNYTQCTAYESIKVSKETAEKLTELMEDETGDSYHGFDNEFHDEKDGQVKFYMYSEEGCQEEELSKEFLKLLGKSIKEDGKEFLEFGYAYTCSKMRAGEFGGGSFRIMTDGEIKYPTVTWE